MTAAIETVGLHKHYGRTTALEQLSLTVQQGTVFGLIGPNGAGKTTALRTMLDIIRPSGGTVRVLGEDPRRAGSPLRRRIGYLPGELRLEGRLSGHRLLAFYAGVSGDGRSLQASKQSINDLADRLGVDLSKPVRSLSKGNKQKIGLIQAFMHRPELLILDEPTSGLDPLIQREFIAMVREARSAGQTVLLSSHMLSEIQQAADDVAVLAAGRLVAEGDVASLRLGAVRRVRALLGAMNEGAKHAGGGSLEDVRRGLAGVPGVEDWDLSLGAAGVAVSGTINGAIDPLVKALAAFEVRELAIEEPDLEESVLHMYGAGGAI
ncbi:ABC transporter ATP-binding protein [Leucobacter salsicius]|uniref:ABC transporter ATP-binding protein n=1 Tax=Leucobacter salsicius TaxID=664638 RepID=UPI00034ADB14|nr:ABC transporter ATP-binding protein [Leucobacter salsicius]